MYFSQPGGVTEVTTQTSSGCRKPASEVQENVVFEPNNAANKSAINPGEGAVRTEQVEEQKVADEDIVEQPEPDEDRHEEEHQVTRSSRVSRPPAWLSEYVTSALDTDAIQEAQERAATYSPQLSRAEVNYYACPTSKPHEVDGEECFLGVSASECRDKFTSCAELSMVSLGAGTGFENTKELRVMKYDEAMASPDKAKLEAAVKAELDKMVKENVVELVKRDELPRGAKVLSSTWVMKKKPNGTYRARMNARGYEQRDGIHYDETDKASPVVADITIRIVMTMSIMARWTMELVDVEATFLNETFEPQNQMFLHVQKDSNSTTQRTLFYVF
jgi:hypothetical protein